MIQTPLHRLKRLSLSQDAEKTKKIDENEGVRKRLIYEG